MKPSNIKVRMGLKQQKSGKLKVELPNISVGPTVNLQATPESREADRRLPEKEDESLQQK